MNGNNERQRRRAEQRRQAIDTVVNWAGNRSHLELVQEMCQNLLGLNEENIPQSITKCKRLLKPIYINLYDYVRGDYDLQYTSVGELIKRCKASRKSKGYGFYPKEQAKTDGLKDLLRHLFARQ